MFETDEFRLKETLSKFIQSVRGIEPEDALIETVYEWIRNRMVIDGIGTPFSLKYAILTHLGWQESNC
jgi:hypothetical protein